jgi:hypothetical protein
MELSKRTSLQPNLFRENSPGIRCLCGAVDNNNGDFIALAKILHKVLVNKIVYDCLTTVFFTDCMASNEKC